MKIQKYGREYVLCKYDIRDKMKLVFSSKEKANFFLHIIKCKGEFKFEGAYIGLNRTTFKSGDPTDFCLKVSNKGAYEKTPIGNRIFDNDYSIYIRPDKIKPQYNYIEIKGDFDDFDWAYKKALDIKSKILYFTGQTINLFVFNNMVFILDSKRHHGFSGIEYMLENKYTQGAKKGCKRGLEKSQAMGRKLDYIASHRKKTNY